MQIGFVGLGRMGLNMVTRLVRGGHAVVAYDRSADAVARAEAAGAKGVSTLDALIEGSGRAARRVGDGPVRRSHRVDGQRARPAAVGRRHDHRRRQHQLSRRCAARADAGGQAPRLRRRRHQRRHLGPAGRLLPDGRRQARGLRAARADLPDAGAEGRLPARRRSRRRPLREDDSQRHRVRPDAGLRRRLRADARQRLHRSISAPSPRSGTRAASSDRGCWS